MLRGYLAGLLSGTAVSGLALGAASLMTDVPGQNAPEATAVEVPAGSEFNQSREDGAATLPRLQDTQTPDEVPQVTAPTPDDLSSLDEADTTSTAQPETGEALGGLSAPEAPEGGSGVAVDSDSPVLPNPQANAPEAPSGEEDLSISTEPAQPVQPEPAEETAAFPEEEEAPELAPVPSEEPQTTEAGEQSDLAEVVEPEPEAVPEAASEPETSQQAAEAAEPADGTVADEEPSSTIGDLAENVTTNRLPTAGGEDTAALTEPATTEGETAEAAAPTEDTRPPIERFAADFENPDDKPLMSIILIDDGSSPIGPDALADFPYPLSFAVDAAQPNAAQTAAKYRAAGLEVLAMTNLPENAAAVDAEVAMETYLAAVPEAVAVFEGTDTGLQSSREASAQLAPILNATGHGLVMFPNGLNTAQKLIAREGVPSATIFRDFDGKGQNASAIRRFLDQAAFRAAQEEQGVIMVGRLRPETISALILWGLQDRAASVALAPVSAVLTAE